MKKHCCPTMDYYLDTETEEELIEYAPDVRKYNFILHSKGKCSGYRQPLFYCPWCGIKMPKDLLDEIEEVLEKEYNLTEKDWWDESKVPEEFKTDEWWKKRGL